MECLDLGGAHGLHMEILLFCFRLLLLLLVSNFVLHCTFVYYLASICGLNLNIWFVICDELCWLVILLWFMFILWFVEVVLILSDSYHIYISCILYASISTCRGNSVKIFKFHIYVLLVFIQIYMHISRGSSLYSSNLVNLFIPYSEIFKKNE